MILRPRYGLPLLAAVLLASAAVEPPWRLVLLVAAMGLALWTAFSLPKPPPRERPASDLFGAAPLEPVPDEPLQPQDDPADEPDEAERPDAAATRKSQPPEQ